MQNDEPKDLLYRNEAAELLGVQEGQIRRYERYGVLPVAENEPHGGQRRPLYRRADVLAIKQIRERNARSKGSSEVV